MRLEPRHRIHPVIRQFARELRQPLTPMEAALWRVLRNKNLGFKFRRQHEIEFFIIDFYCAEVKLCIEIDGESHLAKEQQEYDEARTEYLESLGRTMIRFTNQDVRSNINTVVQGILDTCNELKSKKIDERSYPSS
jgi:very-short-patch-repair endonuclease